MIRLATLRKSGGKILDHFDPTGRLKRKIRDFILSNPDQDYPDYIRERVLDRASEYSVAPESGLISFTTTVWNTPLEFLEPCVESVLSQRKFGSFEWVLLDNGSTNPEVVKYLKTLAERVSEIKYLRVEENVGIIAGNRKCLESASGRYIVPVDSDDLLYPDVLKILTYFIKKHKYPALLFSNEDKIIDERLTEPYFKPGWDPVLFLESCYIAHLCVLDRKLAGELKIYSDSVANGSHDWNSFCQFYGRGFEPVHIPEVLYTWRMHDGSTAMNMNSKSYISTSQLGVLQGYLRLRGIEPDLEIIPSPLFKGTPDWWIRARNRTPEKILILTNQDHSASEIARLLGPEIQHASYEITSLSQVFDRQNPLRVQLKDGKFSSVVILLKNCQTQSPWLLEWQSMRKLFPDLKVLCGKVLEGHKVFSCGAYFDLNNQAFSSPDKSRDETDPGYFAQVWKRHSVDVPSSEFLLVEASWLSAFLETCTSKSALRETSCDGNAELVYKLSLFAATQKGRVAYSPHIALQVQAPIESSSISKIEFRKGLKSYYPKVLGKTPSEYFRPVRG